MNLPKGVYPASVTPFNRTGEIDAEGVLKLLAFFESAGCQGVVLAGTNGEGPSLSAIEKRDLLRIAAAGKGNLKIILAIATSSLQEGKWLCQQTAKSGGDAVLVMAPSYFRREGNQGIREWFQELMDDSPMPVLLYNYPKINGVTLDKELVESLAGHRNFGGIKDSSGDRLNLEMYRGICHSECALFVGDERLLYDALVAGWTGTISGAANLVPGWLSRVVSEFQGHHQDQAQVTFSFILAVIERIRSFSQPEANKYTLQSWDLIESGLPRLPLKELSCPELAIFIEEKLGIDAKNLGVSALR